MYNRTRLTVPGPLFVLPSCAAVLCCRPLPFCQRSFLMNMQSHKHFQACPIVSAGMFTVKLKPCRQVSRWLTIYSWNGLHSLYELVWHINFYLRRWNRLNSFSQCDCARKFTWSTMCCHFDCAKTLNPFPLIPWTHLCSCARTQQATWTPWV
jgi:hypothetical protein